MSDSLRPHVPYSPLNSPSQNTGVGSLSLLQGNLPETGIESRSPALQADSLPAESPGKPKNTGVGNLSLLQGIFPTQGLNPGLLHCRRIRYLLSYQGSPAESVRDIVCSSSPGSPAYSLSLPDLGTWYPALSSHPRLEHSFPPFQQLFLPPSSPLASPLWLPLIFQVTV